MINCVHVVDIVHYFYLLAHRYNVRGLKIEVVNHCLWMQNSIMHTIWKWHSTKRLSLLSPNKRFLWKES